MPNRKRRGDQQWRKRYMAVRKIAINLVHSNLISAYPDRDTWQLRISALGIIDKEVAKAILPPRPPRRRRGKS